MVTSLRPEWDTHYTVVVVQQCGYHIDFEEVCVLLLTRPSRVEYIPTVLEAPP